MESPRAGSDNALQQSCRQPTGLIMDSLETITVSRNAAQPRRYGSSSLLDNLNLSKSRDALIRDAAYARCARRGFTPGQELEDWLAAEQQVDEYLARKIPVGFYG